MTPSGARLLVVDDDPAQRDALLDTLSDEGYEVEACDSPAVALQRASSTTFHLVLTDLQMPEMDGIELTRLLQNVAPDLVVVLMTGNASVPSVVEAMRNGAIDCIQKPFRASTLLPVIERALEVQRLRASNRRLEAEVQRQFEQLVAVNGELDAFAARISHDLRGPLVNMRGILEMAREDAINQALPDPKLLGLGVESGDLALRMVKDMLDFARLGVQPMELVPVELDTVLRDALTAVSSLTQGRNIVWDTGPLPCILGQKGLLLQAFVNLLSNAIKYTAGKEVAHIAVQVGASDFGATEIRFTDNGAGFDSRLADQLFKPFRRLHSNDEFIGEGMGLANVRRIVERHGGAVGAKGSPGEGAEFTLVFSQINLTAATAEQALR
ncbi:sensor histidine kinase [Hydrogenophaga sp. RAC07]|uniref:sensor histidine kinase n=1 Tax=Hydrogenophaga sp. RAC07 TaxID=1842537 RepID=UPI001560E77B|nr:hybrid sensor histidine kinase/response regulator [Hydrogenophaga sp. RAC07]